MDADIRQLRLRTGITVPCLVQDNGPADTAATPVLLLHAWGESRRSFDRLIPLLAGCRIYAPDLRGQGDADKPLDGYSLAEQAEDAAAILARSACRAPPSSAPPAVDTWPSNLRPPILNASQRWCWWDLP
jgi:pimeloyl-ACP methyl ester carboxylesterase